MKYFVALFAFLLTLGLTTRTLAAAGAAEAHCQPDSEATCTDSHGGHGGHHDLTEKMNSLFPEKQKDPALSKVPAVVELTAPKFLSRVEGPARLEWKEAAGANAYHLQVATDPNFKWLVVNEHFVKTNSYEFTQAEAGKKYFWRVAAYNTNNESTFTKSLFSSSAFLAK